MTTARPSQTLLSRCLLRPQPASRTTSRTTSHATASTAATCHPFHTSAPRPARRPRFRSVKAEALGLTTPHKIDEYARSKFPAYDAAQLQGLEEMYEYTPEQLDAVRAGEEVVSARDMALQGRVRDDKARLLYLEDFSAVKPVIDQKPQR
ncbi:hypothetical protein IMZ48_20190, partial [Candidatus Bathyarchaeota archaeon]|nr:hypothetical protein [Candidatus Bathyarchaeota archaeon]